jgi:hypothetical protein
MGNMFFFSLLLSISTVINDENGTVHQVSADSEAYTDNRILILFTSPGVAE